jgi:NDP-sugar pyrophosphorylase family protein
MELPIVILAGGLATRLRPVTEKTPKSLIEINNTPFVLHQLNLLRLHGVEHVHFCLGYLGDMVKEVIEKSIFPKIIKITYSFDGEKLLGTGGAIKKALPQLPEKFFITYGDSFLDIEYETIESYFFSHNGNKNGLMTIFRNENKYDTSNVIFENNQIILYSKKKLSNKMKYIDYGLGILKREHFNHYANDISFDLSEIYETLSLKGRLLGYVSTSRFYEIGSVKGIKDLSKRLFKII